MKMLLILLGVGSIALFLFLGWNQPKSVKGAFLISFIAAFILYGLIGSWNVIDF